MKKYNQSMASVYDKKNFIIQNPNSVYYVFLKRRLEKLSGKKISGKKRVLDVGCGTGKGIFFLYHCKVKEIYGVDISPAMIKKCRKNLYQSNIQGKLILASAEHLPFKDECFDLVVCFSSLHHFQNWKRTLKEIYRVLKKEGECYCVFERRKKGIEKLSHIINFKMLENPELELHQFDKNEIFKEAFSIGFSEVKVKEKDFLEFFYHKLIRKYIPTDFLKILGYIVFEFIDEFLKLITKEYSLRLDIYLRK